MQEFIFLSGSLYLRSNIDKRLCSSLMQLRGSLPFPPNCPDSVECRMEYFSLQKILSLSLSLFSHVSDSINKTSPVCLGMISNWIPSEVRASQSKNAVELLAHDHVSSLVSLSLRRQINQSRISQEDGLEIESHRPHIVRCGVVRSWFLPL